MCWDWAMLTFQHAFCLQKWMGGPDGGGAHFVFIILHKHNTIITYHTCPWIITLWPAITAARHSSSTVVCCIVNTKIQFWQLCTEPFEPNELRMYWERSRDFQPIRTRQSLKCALPSELGQIDRKVCWNWMNLDKINQKDGKCLT